VITLVDLVGLLAARGVGEGVVELLGGEPHGLVAVGGVLQDRESDRICETGVTLTPSARTESMATPAAP
jgi:hypothetical protein